MRISLLLVACVMGLSVQGALAEEPERMLRCLILDGQNIHDWQATTPILRSLLEQSGGFSVEVQTSPPHGSDAEAWERFAPRFSDYDVVVLNYSDFKRDPLPTRVLDDLVDWVRSGGGVVFYHGAVTGYADHTGMNRMMGLGWRKADFGWRLTTDGTGNILRTAPGEGPGAGHGPRHAFELVMRDTDHPITRDLPPRWMHSVDELYHGQRGPAENLHVLATAWSDRTEAHEPLLWVVDVGQGRSFVTLLGHDAEAMQSPHFRTTLVRGCMWAASDRSNP